MNQRPGYREKPLGHAPPHFCLGLSLEYHIFFSERKVSIGTLKDQNECQNLLLLNGTVRQKSVLQRCSQLLKTPFGAGACPEIRPQLSLSFTPSSERDNTGTATALVRQIRTR